MDIKCWLLLFSLLPASHCVEHSHLTVINLNKCWNGKEVPHGPLGIIIMGSRRPTTVSLHLQLLIQLGPEKFWRKFKTISPSFAKITQRNHLLPDADVELERRAATTGGISFLKLLQVNCQSSCFRGLLILCGLPYSLNGKQKLYLWGKVFFTFPVSSRNAYSVFHLGVSCSCGKGIVA